MPKNANEGTTQRIRYRKYGSMNNMNDIEFYSEGINKLSMFGASAMGFPDKISPVRGVMETRHTTQRVVLSHPEFARLYTGAETPYGERSSWNWKAEENYQLIRTFVKFPNAPISPVLYVFKNLANGKYTCRLVKPCENLVEKYGFRMYDKIKGKYSNGDIIPKGTPIAQTSSYIDGKYCAGVNARILYTVLPELTEDALIISESFAKRTEYDMADIVNVKIKKDSFLLNKYGNDNLYKPFPDIGEHIQDKILCSIRENSYISSYTEAQVPHINDLTYWSDGIITDIDIMTNIDVDNDQFNYYLKQIHDWYTEIYSFISTIIADPEQDDISIIDIYHESEKFLNDSKWANKEEICDTIIRFTVLQHKKIGIGQKMVGRYGNKSVVTEIRPDHLMPHSDDGRPFDMLANSLAILNRIIGFAEYECTVTFQMERMHQYLKQLAAEGTSSDIIMRIACEFVSNYNPDLGNEMKRLNEEKHRAVYEDLMNNGFYIQILPMMDRLTRDAICDAYTKWPDVMKKYKIYTKLRHRTVELEGEYAAGYQYIWVLKQEPSKSMSGISTGKTTPSDLVVKTRKLAKNEVLYSDNPIKYGEYDSYVEEAGVGVRPFTKMTTYYRGSQYEDYSVLMSYINNIPLDINRYNQFPQLTNLHNILKLVGMEFQREPYWHNTTGLVDQVEHVMIGNNEVDISLPDLRFVLIIHSYYLHWKDYKQCSVDMAEFFNKLLTTNLFYLRNEEYVCYIFYKFLDLLPVLNQRKTYD